MSTIEQWEKRLEPYFKGNIRFIGEIPLSYRDLEDLLQQVRTYLEEWNFNFTLRGLPRQYPLTMLTCMAIFAAYNDQQNYWQAFADAIGVDKQKFYSYGWHHKFVDLAKEYGLKVFSFKDDHTPFVTSIRYQGGIPSYSLPDYFEWIVLPAIQRNQYRGIPTEKVLEHLLAHAYLVDSPVIDFLRNSDELGILFFTESVKLVEHAIKNHGAILPAKELELPEYVIECFADWWEHREDIKQHWRKPYLQVAPYSDEDAAILQLPEQEIGVELSMSQLIWKICFPQISLTINKMCRSLMSRRGVVTEQLREPISNLVEKIEVALVGVNADTGHEEELRCWNIELIPGEDRPPILAFGADFIRLSKRRSLPSAEVFLLMPLEMDMIYDGSLHEIEELIPLVGAWKDWKVRHLDLRQVFSLQLHKDGNPVGDVIPVQEEVPLPELRGGHLFKYQDEEEPFYTFEAPEISVPLMPGGDLRTRVSNWKIHIRSLWEANPHIEETIELCDHLQSLIECEDRANFPLTKIIGKTAAGLFEITAKGPRGMSATFRIRLWPSLYLVDHSTDLSVSSATEQPYTFKLRLPKNAGCESQPGYEDIAIHRSDCEWNITVPEDINRVKLFLTMPSLQGGEVRVPITVPIPKLQWGLAERAGELEWTQKVLQRSIDRIRQTNDLSLHLDMYGLGELLGRTKIQLVEIYDEEKMRQEARLSHTDFTSDWMRVSLGQFYDTLKDIDSLGRFDLVYIPLGNSGEEIRIPLLEVGRTLDVSNVCLDKLSETSWRLNWEEDRALRNRRVMLVSAWQPWQRPLEYKIPDDAKGMYILENIALPPFGYHIYFHVKPRYANVSLEPPQGIEHHAVHLSDPDQRLKALNEDVSSGEMSANERFATYVELAAIYDDLGNDEKREEALSCAAKDLSRLTNLDLLLGTIKWIRGREIDKPIKSYFLSRMYHENIVRSILRIYSKRSVIVKEYLEFLGEIKNIPSVSAKLLIKAIKDPLVTAKCLRHLFKKKDPDLPAIIIDMLQQSRISKWDAVNLLSHDPEWTLSELGKLDPSLYSDLCITGVLSTAAENSHLFHLPGVEMWMLRALPYEDDPNLIKDYLAHVFEKNAPGRYEVLMKVFRKECCTPNEVLALIAKEPGDALTALRSAPKCDEHMKWINRIVERHPAAAGFIELGSELHTPFGRAVVKKISNSMGADMDHVLYDDFDGIITAVHGEGVKRLKMFFNFMKKQVSIEGYEKIWKCCLCEFIHPDHNIMVHHGQTEHGKVSMRPVSLPIRFYPSDVKLIVKE